MRAGLASSIIKLSSSRTREFWEVPVLWEDGTVLALDKPAQLLTSPDRYDPERPNLMKLLHDDIRRGAPWVRMRGLEYLANAHRLDFETSGVLLLAKSKPALVHLANQFGSEKPLKTYVAIVEGGPAGGRMEVRAPLGPHPKRPGLMRVDAKRGKKSITEFEALEGMRGYTLLECRPRTGRTHQIRVHAKAGGFPIVGDALYGGRPLFLSRLKPDYRHKPNEPERPLIGRVALHASRLEIAHPVTGERMVIESPWPKDIAVALKYLMRFRGGGAEASAG